MKKNRVENYYDAHAAEEWERLERHRTEFAITLKAFEDYLPSPPLDILDIGGGPGRYSLALAGKGYRVTLLDLAESNLQMARQKSAQSAIHLENIFQENALNLRAVKDESFDAVLLMGPLYHLSRARDREIAVQEAKRVIKPGGLIFASFITRYAPFRDYSANDPRTVFTDREQWERMLRDGINFGEGFPDAYFSLPGEVLPLMESQGFSTMQMLGVEGIAAGHEDNLNQLEGKAWEFWVNLNYIFARDPALHAASNHLLYIGMK